MALCGSNNGCGCSLTSSPALTGAIDGQLPTIYVAGSGQPGDAWDITLNDAWANGVPKGIIARASKTAPQAGITTITDVTSATVTFTADPARIYETTWITTVIAASGSTAASVNLCNGAGTQLQEATAILVGSTVSSTIVGSFVESGITGSTTRKLRAENLGASTISVNSAATKPCQITVKDIGPV